MSIFIKDHIKKSIYPILRSLLSSPKIKMFIFTHCSEALIKQRFLREKMEERSAGILKKIFIETRTLCNGKCSFCPSSTINSVRPDRLMSKDLFKKIIYQLKEMTYQNRISLYNNNEPLLDDRIYDFVAFAKKECPDALIEVKTNGMLLTEEKLRLLSNAGLDRCYVNDYHFNLKTSDRLFDLCLKFPKIGSTVVTYASRNYEETLWKNNRAGNNPKMLTLNEPLKLFCYSPFESLTVTTDGSTSVCCNDVLFQNSVGNVHNNSLSEIWQGDTINLLRSHLLRYNRAMAASCKVCDYEGITVGYDFRSIFRYLIPFIA